MPLCGPRDARLLQVGHWRPLHAEAAARAVCPVAITAKWSRYCDGAYPAGRDRLLEWKPSGCVLPAAVPLDGPSAVQAAVGSGNVLRFIGDSLASDHYKFFAGCYLNCSNLIGPVHRPKCQADVQGGGAPTYSNGSRRCEVPVGPQPGQTEFNIVGAIRWDWRQNLIDAGFSSRTADRAIHTLRVGAQGELPLSGCSTDTGAATQYHRDGSMIRNTGVNAPAHIDFRRLNSFSNTRGAEVEALMHLLLYIGPVRLGFNDTVVMSMGLHYKNNVAALEMTMQTIFDWWGKERTAGRAPRLMWRETSPQHFATDDGMYKSADDIITTRQCRTDLIATQQSYPDHNFSRRFVAPWFHVLPTFAPTLTRDDEHVLMRPGSNPLNARATKNLFLQHNESTNAQRPDCSHYCLPSSAMRFWTQVVLSWTRVLHEIAPSEAVI